MKSSILLIIIHLLAFTLVAQTKPYKDITISGHFSEKAIGEFFRDTEFWYYKEVPLNDFIITSNQKFTTNNGNFTLKIQSETPYGFIRCRATQIPSLKLDYFLVEAGDSIFMQVNDKRDVIFYGKGSEKLNYQHFAAKTIEKFKFIQPEDSAIYKVGTYELPLTKFKESLGICLDSLEKIKNINDERTIEILKLNTRALIVRNYLSDIAGKYPFSNETDKSIIINQINLLLEQQQLSAISDPTILNYAINYVDLLYWTQVFFRRLNLLGETVTKEKLKDTYPHLKQDYKGTLRDKLIATLLLKQDKDPEVLNFAKNSLEFIKDPTSYDEITKFVNSRSKGTPAFEFTFETYEGKKVKLADFKGRILIIDTWYKGCSNCAVLAKLLSPLVEKYSKGQKVAFLSVNVDFSRKKFQEGVESGLYGHKNVLHAWTQGNGQNDPFIKHYQYYGYPNILIIDKNGNVITANPFKKEDEVVTNIENFIKANQ